MHILALSHIEKGILLFLLQLFQYGEILKFHLAGQFGSDLVQLQLQEGKPSFFLELSGKRLHLHCFASISSKVLSDVFTHRNCGLVQLCEERALEDAVVDAHVDSALGVLGESG